MVAKAKATTKAKAPARAAAKAPAKKAVAAKSKAPARGKSAATALQDKPVAEQRAELLKLRKEQFALRLQRATGQAVKPDQFGKVRRNIARLKTAMRAHELAQAHAQALNQASGAK